MNIDAPLKLVSQLLDLPIIDSNERWCGIVDDIELDGVAGKDMRIKALLVGPGASVCADVTAAWAIPAVTACHSRYSSPKACPLSSRMACASAPARPKGTAQAATSRMTPACPPERRYLRLATASATTMPAMTHSA